MIICINSMVKKIIGIKTGFVFQSINLINIINKKRRKMVVVIPKKYIKLNKPKKEDANALINVLNVLNENTFKTTDQC